MQNGLLRSKLNSQQHTGWVTNYNDQQCEWANQPTSKGQSDSWTLDSSNQGAQEVGGPGRGGIRGHANGNVPTDSKRCPPQHLTPPLPVLISYSLTIRIHRSSTYYIVSENDGQGDTERAEGGSVFYLLPRNARLSWLDHVKDAWTVSVILARSHFNSYCLSLSRADVLLNTVQMNSEVEVDAYSLLYFGTHFTWKCKYLINVKVY